ncbi:MAG: hypothetical protein GY820_01165 [Gammaproteobacteria bacterium]|nr:hypothetical protein [Gammaproteobacteria bacterium]
MHSCENARGAIVFDSRFSAKARFSIFSASDDRVFLDGDWSEIKSDLFLI